MKPKIRVLVIDDSALIRRLLSEIINSAPDMEVVATAPDPHVAREKIKTLNPDVLTLDVEMPRMDGITFLRNLMRLRPMPVVMVSSLTEKGADVTFDALALGAIDFVTKPKLDISHKLADYTQELIEKIRTAATARIPSASTRATTIPAASRGTIFRTTDQLIAIGASTGGTEAIREVLLGLPPDTPGVVITQHIPIGFSAAFAERMNRQTRLSVKEAAEGDVVLPGNVHIAPGDRHLKVVRDGARYVCQLDDGPVVNRHRPSVDVLFRSVLEAAGRNATAALLTGMGTDGSDGLLAMHQNGLHTIAQDEQSSVVWGMPGDAVRRGAAAQVLPLSGIAGALVTALTSQDSGSSRTERHTA
ncbi:MAG: protein-glutamate methylesterase/protein-glutamine glutaminase [Pseudomonadota bacterium]